MFKKFSKLIIIFLFLSNCGYTPIYSNQKSDINIEVLNFTGDNRINSRLLQKLKRNKNSNTEAFKTKFVTQYKKQEVSRNLAGEIESFELNITINFEVSTIDKDSKFSISENFIMENFNDEFSELNYENKIKDNAVDLIYQKLINRLIRLK